MSFDHTDGREIPQSAPPFGAPDSSAPPAKLSEQGLELLSKNFASLDKDNSGTLDRNELATALHDGNKDVGSTAHALMKYNYALSLVASPGNDYYKWNSKAVQNDYRSKFGNDAVADGAVSKTDIDLMRWTLNKDATDDYLKSLRIQEIQTSLLKTGVPDYSRWLAGQREFLLSLH
jgi:hypothetical protein